jgi:DNA-binding FadR family transcriptional regulator
MAVKIGQATLTLGQFSAKKISLTLENPVMSLQPIVTKRLYQQVAEQIAKLIREKHWDHGDRLPAERDMAKSLGVSRPVLREALVALELQGFVEVRTGAGVYVRPEIKEPIVTFQNQNDPGPSPLDIIDARILIEGEMAAIAATSVDPAGLEGLAEAMAIMDEAIKSGGQRVTNREDGDFLFHSRIAAVSRNTVLQSVVEQLWEDMRRPIFAAISEQVKLSKNAIRALQDHREVYDAIADGDAVQAKKAMHRHLEQVKRVLFQNGDAWKGS